MRFIAEGHIFALTTAAKGNPGPAVEVKLSPVLVVQLKIPLNLNAAIRLDDNLRWHESPS